MSSRDGSLQDARTEWRQIIQFLYPDALSRAYCVPPIYFNRVPYARSNIAGEPVLVLQPFDSEPPPPSVPLTSPPSGSEPFPSSIPLASQPSGSEPFPSSIPLTSQPSSNEPPPPCVPLTSQPSGSEPSLSSIPLTSQPSGSAPPSPCIPLTSQTSGSKPPLPSISLTSHPSGSEPPHPSMPLTSQPSRNVPPFPSISLTSQPSDSEPLPKCISLVNQPSGREQLHFEADQPPECDLPFPSKRQTSPPPPNNLDTLKESDSPVGLWPPQTKPRSQLPKVRDIHVQADFSQQHVLFNLKELGDHLIKQSHTGPGSARDEKSEAMFIISELDFRDYLNKPPFANYTKKLPKTKDLKNCKQGDFDVLIITRHRGILVGELKSVGWNKASRSDADIMKKVREAVEQVDKSEAMLRHLVGDVAPDLMVRKTFFLPYISRQQLERVLSADPQLDQEVCRSLGAGNTAAAVQLCCCSDQVSDPAAYWDITPAVLSQLTTWWQHRMTCTVGAVVTDNLYLDIVARFVGPATSVNVHCIVPPRMEVRTEGEAVAELGRRLACLVLTHQQLDLMWRSPPRVFLTGPPGTGKTIMLVLQGLRWLLQGHDVHIVSINPASLVASVMIQHQLQMMLQADPTAYPTPGTVQLHQYNFISFESDADIAVHFLSWAVEGDMLCVLMDEATTIYRACIEKLGHPENVISSYGLHRLVSELTGRVPHLCIWCASVLRAPIPPELREELLTTPLRCAPSVLREVEPGVDEWTGVVHSYSDSGLPAPGDGPSVIRLSHRGNAHTGRQPLDCVHCGHEVAAELRRLGVGTGGHYATTSSPASLTYRDVLVLTDGMDLQDDVRDDAGNVTSPASGVVLGLRAAGVPVCVLESTERVGEWAGRKRHDAYVPVVDGAGWESRMADVAMARTDQVTVAYYTSVQGLERRVVVWLTSRSDDRGVYPDGRLLALSRCTTQLMIVDQTPDDSHTENSDSTLHSHTPSENNACDEDETTEDRQPC